MMQRHNLQEQFRRGNADSHLDCRAAVRRDSSLTFKSTRAGLRDGPFGLQIDARSLLYPVSARRPPIRISAFPNTHVQT